MDLYIKCITVLLFIYNSILGYVIVKVTNPYGSLPLLALIVVDYVIIYYFVSHSVSKYAKHHKKHRR